MEYRKDILWRTYFIYILMIVFAVFISYRIINIQFIEGEKWKEKSRKLTTAYIDVEAARGNIFDANGNLLATSLPYYEVAIDVNAPSIPADTFSKHVDSLAICLSTYFGEKDKKYYKSLLKKARQDRDRYLVLKRNVSYRQLQVMKTFPLLRKGKKGGLTYLQTNKRERPFQMLAARTIGYSKDNVKVGIEGEYDSILKGISGKRLMQKIASDVWRPINDDNEIEPKNGNDVHSTIDINIQDVAENALYKALVENNASHGCAVLMEVKTGEIRAIANLTRTDSALYNERFNYAIGYTSEPGSTFKLASLLAAIDDGYVDLDDEYKVGNGKCQYFDREMKDSHSPEATKLTVKRIFETSSNVGVSQIIYKNYSKDPQKFLNKLSAFQLDKPLGIKIPGERPPKIKKLKSTEWYGTTLPWMSIGYETGITPLQTLSLYNAIANNGKMVRPMFVREIKSNGKTIKKFNVEILSEQIVKPETVKKAKEMLEGVVQNGTGKKLNIDAFPVAGKTGTAQIAFAGKSYGSEGNRAYQATFVGYFPANNPLYSCIVVIYNPSAGNYYGGLVAGPVFKEIAEKVYSSSLDFHKEINSVKKVNKSIPVLGKIKTEDADKIFKELNIDYQRSNKNNSLWLSKSADSNKVYLTENGIEKSLSKGIIPDLWGLTARDAVHLLENSGVHVKFIGFGKVKRQSLEAGSRYQKGTSIVLTLG